MNNEGGKKRGRGRGRGRPRGSRSSRSTAPTPVATPTPTTRGARGRGRGRGRGRPKKIMVIESESEEEEQMIETSETVDHLVEIVEDDRLIIDEDAEPESSDAPLPSPESPNEPLPEKKEVLDFRTELYKETTYPTIKGSIFDLPTFPNPLRNDKEFAKLSVFDMQIAPIFATIARKVSKPAENISWDHTYKPLGERIMSPNIHMCQICRRPIRIYGRLIPCKHIFCKACAHEKGQNRCPRCSDRVYRIEQASLGSVYMCDHEGHPYGYEGCKRTYLSVRDLQAHYNHRHRPRPPQPHRSPERSDRSWHKRPKNF